MEDGSTPTRPVHTPAAACRRRLARQETWRVGLSHTSDLAELPPGRSFVQAAQEAVKRAGHGLRDMGLLCAGPRSPDVASIRMVEQSDVYVGIIGHRYGTAVPVRPDLSYTELEFETATRLGLPRLVFLIEGQPVEHRRQLRFRRRLEDEAGLTIARVVNPADLEIGLFQALVELRDELRNELKGRGSRP
jgi:hypothetical protein